MSEPIITPAQKDYWDQIVREIGAGGFNVASDLPDDVVEAVDRRLAHLEQENQRLTEISNLFRRTLVRLDALTAGGDKTCDAGLVWGYAHSALKGEDEITERLT